MSAPGETPADVPAQLVEQDAEDSYNATEAANSVKVSLADLCAKGTSQFAHKNYSEAADYFARASELQAELNGEMHPDNAEVLFHYGRSLFKVGQSKSDVLGGRAGGEKKKPKGADKKEESKNELNAIREESEAIVAEQAGNGAKPEEDSPKKPLFQFTGDENFEDSDDEEDDGENQGDDEEEVDDLADAFEILDLARVLYSKKLEEPEEESKGKEVGESPTTMHIKERLGDTHDLLAEISLENERFPNAVSDFKAALQYKEQLYSMESEILAEAHYKLSLALEFNSVTRTKDEGGDNSKDVKEEQVDEAMREDAAKEMEAAITSTKAKLQTKEVELASTFSVDDNDITIEQINNVKQMIGEMEQRLLDLRAPPIDVNAALNGPAGAPDTINPMGGLLGATLGESAAEAHARIEEAKKTATDVSGLVRKKAKPESTNGAATNGKRKAEDVEEPETKKAKVEDTPEE